MEVIYRNGKATAAEIRRAIDDAPSYSAIRAFLRILTKKGYVGHEQDGPRYVYFPQVDREKVQRSMINKVLDFFNGSAESVVATLLDISKNDLTEDDFERLTQLIQRAKREGR
ncbi:BlaI/MecI/CopY family transcriptional regulator [candidate division KSB1 bacterium]|nr:BlaI/MecI/CopY family transcriptional regulator [candidate division KSB1 bacterium]